MRFTAGLLSASQMLSARFSNLSHVILQDGRQVVEAAHTLARTVVVVAVATPAVAFQELPRLEAAAILPHASGASICLWL